MGFFNYHATAQNLIAQGKLIAWYYTDKHNAISPALVLVFADMQHPKMPIRSHAWEKYIDILPIEKQIEI